ncbi:MAG TPA: flagellar assembly protein A, partial [Spirochaetia bacterium]|nr:flagellar assembly protein A [Spirochaetia bacterium]
MTSGLRFKGTITVVVDPSRLMAKFQMSKQGDLEYDEGALVKILADAGVTEGFEPDDLTAAVWAFQKSKESIGETQVAQGTPPAAPEAESWEWEESLSLPDDQKALASRVSKAAGAPEVYQVRIEKVKVQKKVAGKGGLFGPGQEEIQTVIETREVKAKVLVDPNPVRVAWVEAGAKLATVYGAKQGQPGRDLGGKPIAAPSVRATPFLTGKNLQKEKTEAIARETGLLRIGRGWADIVPFRLHRWDLTYSSDKTSAFLTFEPGDALADPVSAEAIAARLVADGFTAEPLPTVADIQSLVDGAMKAGQSLISQPLVPDRDGTFEIRFSPDRTKAFLDIHKPLGHGAPFSLKDLGTRLREAQLKGFSFDAVKGAIQDFLNGPQTELREFLLASGTAPTRGKDLELVYSVGFLPEKEQKEIFDNLTSHPKYLETVPDRQTLPPEKVERAAPVRADQEFARLEAPSDGLGAEGLDVTGHKIPGIP